MATDETPACACRQPSRPGEHSEVHCRVPTTWGELTDRTVGAATAARPWMVTLCWTWDQNGGAVSVHPSRSPVHAVLGRLRAGEARDEVAQDFGLAVEAVEVLARLADELADAGATHLTASDSKSGRRGLDASAPEPADLDTLVGWVESALDSSAIEVEVHELEPAGHGWRRSGHGWRRSGQTSPLSRLVRCLRVNGLLDEGDKISLGALRALAGGEPPGEVAEDHGIDPWVVRAVLPLVGRAAGAAVPPEQEAR